MMRKITLLFVLLLGIFSPAVMAQKNSYYPRKKAVRFSVKKDTLSEKDFSKQLTELRQQIDNIDYQILEKMAQRMQVSQEIGQYKRKNGMGVLQRSRWHEILKKRKAFAQTLGLDTTFTINLLELIHRESIRNQTEFIK